MLGDSLTHALVPAPQRVLMAYDNIRVDRLALHLLPCEQFCIHLTNVLRTSRGWSAYFPLRSTVSQCSETTGLAWMVVCMVVWMGWMRRMRRA